MPVVLSNRYNLRRLELNLDNTHHEQIEYISYEVLRDSFDDENENHFVNDYMCLTDDPRKNRIEILRNILILPVESFHSDLLNL